jgi:hypothetical protein
MGLFASVVDPESKNLIQIQHFKRIRIQSRVLMTKNLKNTAGNFFYILFFLKNCNLLISRPRPRSFLPPWIWISIRIANPDQGTPLNSEPIGIWIHNTAVYTILYVFETNCKGLCISCGPKMRFSYKIVSIRIANPDQGTPLNSDPIGIRIHNTAVYTILYVFETNCKGLCISCGPKIRFSYKIVMQSVEFV